MVTAVKSKAAPAAPAPTFAEIAAKRMRETVEKYREHVRRAASGERMAEEHLGQVLELLSFMHLPQYAWERDVAAHRDYMTASKAAAECQLKRPASESRLQEVVARIKEIEAELKSLRGEQYTLAEVEPMTRVGHGRRMNELEANHPHVFADIDTAARLRSEAKAKATGGQAAPMAASEITTGAWAQ